MTIRLDMRRAVTEAKQALGDSIDVVKDFYRRHLNDDGGFAGRDGRSDLYYTVFGLEASLVLGAQIPYERVVSYLDTFGVGESLTSCIWPAWFGVGPIWPSVTGRASIRPCLTRWRRA